MSEPNYFKLTQKNGKNASMVKNSETAGDCFIISKSLCFLAGSLKGSQGMTFNFYLTFYLIIVLVLSRVLLRTELIM